MVEVIINHCMYGLSLSKVLMRIQDHAMQKYVPICTQSEDLKHANSEYGFYSERSQ